MLALKSGSIPKKNLYFRVDAGSNIGLGHLMRSSALADILSEYFNCILLTFNLPDLLFNSKSVGFQEIVNLDSSDPIYINNYIPKNSIIVLDGYHFDNNFQKYLKSCGHLLVSIDDIQATHFVSDIIINHGVNIDIEKYSCEEYTKKFVGLDYIMLRDPFYNLMPQKKNIKNVENLLVIPGGNDLKEISMIILQNHDKLFFKNIHIISGAGSNSFEKIITTSKSIANVIVHQNLDANELIKVARNCEICICTPSGISYEMSCIGIGLILCKIAENQQHFYDFFVDNQLAFGCDFYSSTDSSKLIQLIHKLKSNIQLVNQQIQNQKMYFKNNAKKNLIKIFENIV